MNNEIDRLLDLQIEATQISIYCDIIRNLLLKHRSISIIKVILISFIIKKRQCSATKFLRNSDSENCNPSRNM